MWGREIARPIGARSQVLLSVNSVKLMNKRHVFYPLRPSGNQGRVTRGSAGGLVGQYWCGTIPFNRREGGMSCLGVHFALTADDVAALRATAKEDRPTFVAEQLEERYFAHHKSFVGESDKAWDAMHRALADGKLSWDGGTFPLNHAVLAGELLYTGADYIMSLKTPTQVSEIAVALDAVTQESFRRGYDAIDTASYQGDIGDEDFAYTWEWFCNVRDLYRRAALESRYVLFTADQ